MKIHRFIGSPNDEKILRQVRKVLKLEAGEQAIFGDGKGKDQLFEYQGKSGWKFVKELEPIDVKKRVHLYLAILKKENFELAVQKAVECGATSITPLITERTVKTGLNTERLEKIIKEACEQSGRSFLPYLLPITDFQNALKNAPGEKIIFHLGGEDFRTKNIDETSIFVGPEGGFTEKEIVFAKESGFSVASLGELTLRGETAAIIGTYRAVYGI